MAFLTGGNQGRPKYQHMGTSGVKKGSPPKPKPYNPNSAAGRAVTSGAKPKGKQPWRPAPPSGRPRWQDELARMAGQSAQKKRSTPKPPANIFASGAWKSPYYNDQILDLKMNIGQQQRDLNKQLAYNKNYYDEAKPKIESDYRKDLYQNNASLAGRGIYQSGMRETADTDRRKMLDSALGQMAFEYGSYMPDGSFRNGFIESDLKALGDYLTNKTESLGGLAREEWAAYQAELPPPKGAGKPKSGSGSKSGGGNPWVKKGGTIFYKGKNGLVEAPKQKHAAKMFKKQQAKQKNKGKGKK